MEIEIIAINRLSTKMLPNELQWEMTLKYFKVESKLTKIFVSVSMMTLILSNTFFPLLVPNDNHTPFNFHAAYLPFEIHSLSWALNFVYQIFLSVSMVIFFVVYFPMTLILMNHTCWAVDSVVLQVEDLNAGVTRFSEGRDEEVKPKLRKIIQKTHYMIATRSKVQKLLQYCFTTDFSILSFVLCLSFLSVITSLGTSDPVSNSIVSAVIVLTQLYIYCSMGSKLSTRIDYLADALYCSEWYLFSSKQQKVLQLILYNIQKTKGFKGMFKAVNLRTFQEVSIDF